MSAEKFTLASDLSRVSLSTADSLSLLESEYLWLPSVKQKINILFWKQIIENINCARQNNLCVTFSLSWNTEFNCWLSFYQQVFRIMAINDFDSISYYYRNKFDISSKHLWEPLIYNFMLVPSRSCAWTQIGKVCSTWNHEKLNKF